MRRKILIYSIVIIFISCVITGLFAYNIARRNYYDQAISNLKSISNIYNDELGNEIRPEDAAARIEKYAGVRVTIVDKSGKVVYESRSEKAPFSNHLQRPEIKAAFESGYGESIRYSSSESTNYVYVAKRFKSAGQEMVVRFSVTVSSLSGLERSTIIYVLLGVLTAAVISLFLSIGFSKKITDPITRINKYATDVVSRLNDFNIYKTAEIPGSPKSLIINNGDEIGSLSAAVGMMTQKLSMTLNNSMEMGSRLNTIVNSMSGAIVAIDSDNNIILANEAASGIFGMKNCYGKYYGDFIRNKDLKDFIESRFDDKMNEPEGMIKELKLWDSTYLLRKTPIKTHTNYSGIVFIMVDIGELRKLEHIRSNFAANVTHELKTPLTSIKGFVETLKNNSLDDKDAIRRFLDIIEIETDRLTNLIQDILQLSQIENTPSDYGVVNCSLEDIMDSVNDVMRPLAERKNITIYTEIKPESAYVHANPDRIKQLLLNLMGNAVYYNNDGGWVRVNVSKQANNIIFKVEDNGIGIGREHLDRIFERFYTVNQGRSRKNSGTGLGLSIVKHIALLYDGKVGVDSEPGKGSVFTVSMPIAACNE